MAKITREVEPRLNTRDPDRAGSKGRGSDKGKKRRKGTPTQWTKKMAQSRARGKISL